jgi:glycosyltransferase involved in cell wall biosynthesis
MSDRAGTPLFFVVPGAIDDAARVSGGNRYDQHVRDGLRKAGWDVRMVPITDSDDTIAARLFAELPDGALVLIDGLIAVRESASLAVQASRLRIVVLAHMLASLYDDHEREALRSARRIIATSGWTRTELLSRDLAEPGNVVVAEPGTSFAATTGASLSGGRLLCVGVVAPHKGQDLLVRALARLTDVDGWTCTFAGSLDVAAGFVDELKHSIRLSDLGGRTMFTGTLAGASLDLVYAQADLLVVPSRNESFGMVVAEALARGIPVLASRVGGIPEAMAGTTAGILVPPEDPWALEVVLRQWWGNEERRTELKAAAVEAREAVRPWSAPVAVIASTLTGVAREAMAVSA